MASADMHLSLIPTAKRSACDRCRKHKVACPPRNNIASDCARCVRVGAACVTGFIKPLGKSTIRRQSKTPSDAMSTTTCTSSPSQSSQPSHCHDVCDATELTEPIEPWPLPDLEDGDLISGPWEHWAALPIHSEGLQTWVSGTTSAPSLEMLQSWDHAPPFEQNMLNSQDRQPVSAPTSRTQLSSSPGQSPSSSYDVRKDLEIAEYNLRLCQLRVNLARQMMPRASRSPDLQSSMADEADSRRNSFPSHTVGEALCSTSEFLDLVRSYKRLSGSTRPHGDPTGLLDLLVSYLHLVAVFNCLFQQLHDALSSGSLLQSGAMQGLHPLPNLHLSGFAVSEGKLQTRILLQATQHQFQQVERDLGIPPEFAVSLRTRGPNNNNNNSTHGDPIQALFQIVFSEDQNSQGMVSASSVSTLRTNIAMMGRLLDELEN